MGKIRTRQDNADSLNFSTFTDYQTRLSMLAQTAFEWINLPKTVSARYIERLLYEKGKILFFRDDEIGFLALDCVGVGNLNPYMEHTEYTASNVSYPARTFSIDDCVLIRNNYFELPTFPTIDLFCYRLYEAERTIDTNVKAMKTPTLILCEDKTRLSLQQVYAQYDGNQPFIFGDKNILSGKEFTVLKTDAPVVFDKVSAYKSR